MQPIKLSKLIKFDSKNAYPPQYKHMLDALQKAYAYIYDNHGNGLFVDDIVSLRFKIGEEWENFELSADALYNLLKGAGLSKVEYKYQLYGEPTDFTKIEVD